MSNNIVSGYKFEADRFRTPQEFDEAFIRENPLNIRYFPFMQERRDFALLAVGINGLARVWLDPKLQEDPEIAALAEKNLPTKFNGIKPAADCNNRIFAIDRFQTGQLRNVGTYNEINYVQLEKGEPSIFLRDSHLPLFSGEHLIPYTMKNPQYNELVATLLPSTAEHFITQEKEWIGCGFLAKNTDQAMVMSYDYNIPFKRAKTCIEGGNCFLFESNGVKKAIIGELSLYISMVALGEQRYFDHLDMGSCIEPSEDAFRRARNLHLYNIQTQNPGSTVAYRGALIAPVSDEDRVNHLTLAKRMHLMLEETKKCIAEELEIPLAHMAFVPQTEFHIDKELCVTPKGEVILQDDQKTDEFLRNIKGSTVFHPDEALLFLAYEKTNLEHLQSYKEILQKRKQILESHGLKVHPVPAVLEALEYKSSLNYCNGIFLENADPLSGHPSDRISFVATGPSYKEEFLFHRRFIDLFQRTFPDIEIKAIPNMSKFIAEYAGGIHCLTTESYPLIK